MSNVVWNYANYDIIQGHVIMMSQPQSIYQRVIDKTKGLAFQAQFLAQSIEKRLQAQAITTSKTPPPSLAVCSRFEPPMSV